MTATTHAGINPTPTRTKLLTLARTHGVISTRGVRDYFDVQMSSLSRSIRELEAAGLLQEFSHAPYAYALTPTGAALLANWVDAT